MIPPQTAERTLRSTMLGTVPAYQFEALADWPVRHAIFTRHGGVSAPPFDTLNLSWVVGDSDEAVAENVRRVYAALNTTPAAAARVHMVHDARVAAVDDSHAGRRLPATDGLVTTARTLPLAMTFADCQPILLYDPVQHALALGHAGWRGTVSGIALSLVQALTATYGSAPADLVALLGPAIGACCYEVGRDVIAAAGTWPDGASWLRPGRPGHAFFDLTAANTAQLRHAGVGRIETAGICTACRTDDFFSYRAEKPATGRFGVLAMLT